MREIIKLLTILFALASTLLLTGCGGSSGSVHHSIGVYSGYHYPHHGYDRDVDVIIERPDRPDRPNRPDRPTIQPVPRKRPAAGMGRPSRRR